MGEALSSLCQQCGLCCDGTLFVRVSVTEQEAALLERHGVASALRAKNKRVLPQPCSALEGRRCSCYAARPTACREYVCLLARALEEGEVALAGAVEVVGEALRRRERVEALLPKGQGDVVRRAREVADGDAAVRTALDSLETHLRHYFLGMAGAHRSEER